MRVICVDENAFPKGATKVDDLGKIVDGNTYEVVDVWFDEGYIWYEVSIDLDYGYWENCFARCSNVDETELIKERQEQCV